jgi:anaerobic selenocysteine-containing dehydrogenase
MVNLGGTLLPEHILLETSETFPLRMITPHEKYRIHSQNDNVLSLKKLSDDRLWISIYDAEKRNIVTNERVRVISPDGSIEVETFVSDKISRGTVSLNQGVWAEKSGKTCDVNANYLSSTIPAMPSKGSRTHSIIVNILKI